MALKRPMPWPIRTSLPCCKWNSASICGLSGKRTGGTPLDIDYYFYAREAKNGGWSLSLLLELLHRGASSQLEWLEGKLLGYSDEQNDIALANYPADRLDQLNF